MEVQQNNLTIKDNQTITTTHSPHMDAASKQKKKRKRIDNSKPIFKWTEAITE